MRCDGGVLDKVYNTIKKYDMLSDGDSVLVGLSGGADSVCLLHCLYTLKDRLGIKLYAAHLNHGIRGDEAARDMELARNMCNGLSIPFYTKSVDVPLYAHTEKLSEETAGRLARYKFFAELKNKHNIDKTATAHNRNDQAETVLMRIIRGTGTDGLSGILYCRGDGTIRPLLDVERCEIEEYCLANGLEYCIDSTNEDESYTRNKIRKNLLPMLADKFNPNIVEALATLSQNAAGDAAFINGYAQRLYKRINNPSPSKRPVVLDTETLKMVDEGIQVRLIRLALADAMGNEYKTEKEHIKAVLNLLRAETGTEISLPQGLVVAVRYGWLAFETAEDRKKFSQKVKCLADTEVVPGNEYTFGDYIVRLELSGDVKPEKGKLKLDYDKLKDKPLILRTRKIGDRISVFKNGKTKKLKNYMIDEKIPSYERDTIPLLCSGNEVVAVIGKRAAETYKADNKTKRGLVVTYGTAADFSG